MKTIRETLGRRGALALLLAIVPAALLLGGCESDSTAPQDPAPALSEQEAAAQAGLVAMAVTQVGPEVINFAEFSKTEPPYSRAFVGDVSGTVYLDFRLGGADGAHATWVNGNWVRLYTEAGSDLVITIGEMGGTAALGLDINAALNRVGGTAVVNGGGTFATGPYAATFAFDDLAVQADGYPTGGSMTFNGGGFVMTVAFDGTNIATVTVQGLGTWYVNLDTGEVSQNV